MKIIHGIILGIALLGMVSNQASAGPANDNFANRTLLTGTNIVVQGSNSGAGTESGEYIGGGNIYYFYSVWYEWTAPTNGVLYVSGSTSAPNFLMSVSCYRGSAVDALAAVSFTPDGGIPVTPGDKIIIKVASIYYPSWGGGGGTGPFSLTFSLITPTPTSSNNMFASRLNITGPTYHFNGSIYGATTEPGEPLPGGATQTLWWSFVPFGNGILNLATSTAQFTPTLTIYQGNQFGSMQTVLPFKGTMYYLQANHVYSIQMASGYVAGGAFSLDAQFYPEAYDTFANSDQIEGTNVTYHGNFTLATTEAGEPFNGASNTVWMSWAAPADGYAQVSKASAPQFQYYSIYTGSSVDHLQPVNLVAYGYNSIYRFLVTKGTVYHFQFSGGADNFTFYLQFQPIDGCPSDNFNNAVVWKGNAISDSPRNITRATMELGEPLHLGNIPQKSIWWKWQSPGWGTFAINPSGSLASPVVLAAYTGNSVEALSLVAKSTNSPLYIPVTAAKTYYIAAAVPADVVGDVLNFSQFGSQDTSAHIIPGNLLQEPSWEGTAILNAQYWKWTGGLSGYVNEGGDVDGSTWPAPGGGTVLWQDFPTIPGHSYTLRFAWRIGGQLSGGSGDALLAVGWDNRLLGIATIPESESGFWHWNDYTVTASNTTSRIIFTNLARNIEMDAFSVVDGSAPPAIVQQPASVSSIVGGTAAFIVGATGTLPMSYQWFFNNSPLEGQTNKLLVLNSITPEQAGNYWLAITNAFGHTTSSNATLVVDAPADAAILSQPYGDAIPVGGYFNFSVVAAGTPPLMYQWYLNNTPVTGATNSNLMLTNVQPDNAGTYTVQVKNISSTAWSLPATLVVDDSLQGGGLIDFRNHFFVGISGTNDAPIFDLDGMTPLNGSRFVAQLYAGPSLDKLRPAGQPTPFQEGFSAGYFVPQTVTLASVAPGANAVLQVCAWDASYGTSYEQARALGGRFGKSGILQVTAGGGFMPPQPLQGLQSFSLQAGLPYFEVGTISFVKRQPPDTIVWALNGQPDSIYLIEKKQGAHNSVWQPYIVVTNVTGTVTFTDTANSGAATVLYRARILD